MKLANALVEEQKWKDYISSLKTKKTKNGDLKKALIQAIKKRLPNKKFGIAFSGGVDSSFIAFICKQLNADFVCYAVGIENSTDLIAAKKAAKLLGVKLVSKQYSLPQAEKIIKKVVSIVGTDPVKVGVGCVTYACGELAKKDKINILFTGLGSEEIFAGYERHKVKDINLECWSGLKAMWDRDFVRDIAIAKNLKFTTLTPFLDKDLIEIAMSIDGKLKLDKNYKKIPLRKIAEELGLPKEIAWRKKQAAQYGSKFDRAIFRLARQNKLKYKKDYLNNQFKLGTLYSSGKDSTYALYMMQKQNYKIECLITLKSKNSASYMFHTPNIDIAKYQAKSLNIPLLEQTTLGKKEIELKDLKKILKKAKSQYKIQGIVTGALYSNYQRERIEKVCDKLGLKVFSPLWHMNQETEMREILQQGFKIILSAIAAEGFDKTWLGKLLTEKDIDKLVQLNKKVGINIAGEGGEFESLVLDGPNFKKALKIIKAKTVMENEITGQYIVEKVLLINK